MNMGVGLMRNIHIMMIKLVRLPDINTSCQLAATPYQSFGRFALLRGGAGFWWGDLHSSHPSDTVTGYYWALDENGDLAVSARGAGIYGEVLVNERRDILALLVAELVKRKIIGRPTSLQLQE